MMFVVDTNVAIVANGRGIHANNKCQSDCIQKLKSLVTQKIVAIDDRYLILKEYREYMNPPGEPGVGDMFFKHVFNNLKQYERIRLVTITPSADERRSFEELPENTFDPSDRKFLAVAVVAKATVLNATDNDWHEHRKLMSELGVKVEQLCPQHIPTNNDRESRF